MIKNITHQELVSILMQIHDELPSRFFQHWMRVTINKLNYYEDTANNAKKELGFTNLLLKQFKKTKKHQQNGVEKLTEILS